MSKKENPYFIWYCYWMLFLTLIMCSCERDTLRDYPYRPEQPTQLYVNVIPMDDVKINMNSLNLEANADYFNRYGINVNFRLQQGRQLDDDILGKQEPQIGRIFLPREALESPYEINMWVLPPQNVMAGVGGYATSRHNFVVRDRNLYGTTVPHEIGHCLGLGHMPNYDNTMFKIGNSESRDDPKNFIPAQIDTMLRRLADPVNINSTIYN